jgi:hypothetical protein
MTPSNSADELIAEIEEAIPDERKNLSFGDEGESIVDVMEQSERKMHRRGGHDGEHPTCPLCNGAGE